MRHNTILRASASMPRGLAGRVFASANPPATIAEIGAALDAFKAKYDTRQDQIEAALNDRLGTDAIASLGAPGPRDDPEYSTAFASYARRGAAEAEASLHAANSTGRFAAVQAAMSVGDNSSGGYIAPVEWDRQIRKALRTRSPMRRLATVMPTGVGGYSTLWNNDQWGTGWVGETAARPATSTPTMSPLVFSHGEIYANVAATQTILDDAQVDLETWLIGELTDTFDKQEGVAFISGDGVNKPIGLLQYIVGGAGATAHPGGTLDVVASGNATTIPGGDILMDFKYGLLAPYRQNATWLMNSQTAAAIAKMKDGQGAYIWREGLAEDQPTTLLGRPVEIDEGMPSIGAGTYPIAFGDFRAGYVINDRMGVRVLRDPYTNKPFVMFYATKRVGAGVKDPRAIRLLKVAAS